MKSFENDVLPLRFGLDSIKRDNLIQVHTTDMAKTFFVVNDQLLFNL